MTIKKLLSTIIILSAIFVLMVPSLSVAETIKWKAQALWSAAELSYQTFVDFCERVKVLTNGRLEITPYPGGTIVPTFELLEAVQNNVLQAMHSWPGYYSGKEPGFAAISDLDQALYAFGYPVGARWRRDFGGFLYLLGGSLSRIVVGFNGFRAAGDINYGIHADGRAIGPQDG